MRFLHSADWQLGLPRHALAGDARGRYADDRFEAIVRIGAVAAEVEAAFVVVAGDVFDSNRVGARTVRRGLDALGAVPVPVLLLPGNHDPLDAASVYRSALFAAARPPHVEVLADGAPREVVPGIEVVAAPWTTKRPGTDLVAELAAGLAPAPGLRVAVAHGAVDELSPDRDDPAAIGLEAARRALTDGRFHYLALGDRHSVTRVDERIWYAGTPEATDFDEERPGRVLVVELAAGACRVEERVVGRWRFVRHAFDLAAEPDVARLAAWFDEQPEKARTVLQLTLAGELPLHARVRLDETLEGAAERFAAVDCRDQELVALPDVLDRDALELSGYAERAFERLLADSRGTGEEAAAARDALALLYRLAGPAAAPAAPGSEAGGESGGDGA